ncbi:MAG: Stk1 family PASTA domain-containing Ser/Thr kinase [Actinobacteria bacterium]|nr:Stk1 family PASTA domain-containing Ser/Thr kinase [Actinomycetota bacterium]
MISNLINTLFDGRYRVIRKLGAGGMADVYLAEDEELGRRVAIKILNDRHANDESFVERFRREAKNAAGLSHPNIVSIYDRGEAEGTYYIAMEYLDGRTLKELLIARGPMSIVDAIHHTRQTLTALRFAHKKGVVHRDIKPHNVMVDADGRLKVTDFGIARAGASQMTEAGAIVGTAQYLSPEQARGAAVDQRSDLYSIGVVLYEMLTGSVPFTGDSPVEIAMKHLSDTPRPPSSIRPEIPPDLDMVVLRALAKNPDDRFQTAEEMDAELARIAEGGSVTEITADAATAVLSGTSLANAPTAIASPRRPQRRPTNYRYQDPPPRRRPLWPWLLAILGLVAALLAGWFAYDRIQDSLSGSSTVSVPNVEGIREHLAVQNLLARGLEPDVKRKTSEDPRDRVGFVYDQDPNAGIRVDKTSAVTIFVSLGPPKVTVPKLVGQSRDDAIAALTERGLKFTVADVFSKEDEGEVVDQFPTPGKPVNKGSSVRINVSRGLQPVGIPTVVGETYESAASQLQAGGFAVARQDVDSDQPKGIVVRQSPAGGAQASRGSTVTLSVSKGPKESAVPDVTSQQEDIARATLESSGFDVVVQDEETTDPNSDGIVLNQDPAGGTKAAPGTTVTIFVGRLLPTP